MEKIILLHGALGCGEQLFPLRDLLASRYDVMIYTFNGHGTKSEFQKPFTISSLADGLADFLREQLAEPIRVFGYSMGGYVALWLARHQPHLVEKIITLGTKVNWNEQTVEHETKLMVPEKVETKVPAFARHLHDLHGESWKNLMMNTAGMMRDLVNHHLKAEDFRQINQLTLLCLGDGDNMVTKNETEQTALMMPNGKFHLMENTLHPIEKVNAQLLAEVIKTADGC